MSAIDNDVRPDAGIQEAQGAGRAVGRGAASGSDGLPRLLSWLDGTAIFVGIVLGSGIFVAPALVAGATAGATGWGGMLAAAGLWLLGGLVAACGALCYAECGARLPHTGGFYVFYREAYGEGVAFTGGWAAQLITYPASLAAIGLICGEHVVQLWPGFPGGPVAAATGALLLSGGLNAVGLRAGATAQRVLTSTKVLALALLCLAALVAAGPAPAAAPSLVPSGGTGPGGALEAGALLGALVVLLWTYDGWSDVTLVSGELRDPGRTLALTVLLATAVLVVLYVAVQLSVLALLPAGQAAAADKAVVATAVAQGLGPASGRLVAALVVLCTFGSLNGVVLAASRLSFAMARDRLFFRWLGSVHPRFGTPARSVWTLVGAALVYVFAAGFRSLLDIFSFNVWLFYGTTAVALLLLRRRDRPGAPAVWRTPGGPIVPLVVLLTAASISGSLLVHDPLRCLAGLGLLAAGVPVYLVWRRATRRERAGQQSRSGRWGGNHGDTECRFIASGAADHPMSRPFRARVHLSAVTQGFALGWYVPSQGFALGWYVPPLRGFPELQPDRWPLRGFPELQPGR